MTELAMGGADRAPANMYQHRQQKRTQDDLARLVADATGHAVTPVPIDEPEPAARLATRPGRAQFDDDRDELQRAIDLQAQETGGPVVLHLDGPSAAKVAASLTGYKNLRVVMGAPERVSRQ